MKQRLILEYPILRTWVGQDPFDAAVGVRGEVFRDVGNRRTIKFDVEGKNFFIKVHTGVGWKEVIKNWLTLRRPVVDASTSTMHACICAAEASTPRGRSAWAYGARTSRTDSPLWCARHWKTT
ncbi:MAG: hypothetical protein HC809_06680 [Gammaproteobacteria bacterium]|nr:hypothetical protein [Gammaproteobacteria bacterium]